jgi:hypothetical protein
VADVDADILGEDVAAVEFAGLADEGDLALVEQVDVIGDLECAVLTRE